MMQIKEKLEKIVKENNLLNENIEIKPVNVELDTTNINDYPLLNAKESLLRAFFKGCVGDAFTGNTGEFKGTIKEVLDNNNMPQIIATLNAIMRYLKKIDRTEHCICNEPEKCGKALSEFLIKELPEKNIGEIKIGIIGYQPAFIKQMVETFGAEAVLVSDLNFETVGRIKHGTIIYHGDMNEHIIGSSDIVLCTGSTAANGTLNEIVQLAEKYNKRIIFYGTTIAGVANLFNIERFCELGK
ncbi:Rossmann-like domain-containing protein [Methanococcus aeolicus]|nr:DUF364 domain-containing protein [Methanococcus aeolicus]